MRPCSCNNFTPGRPLRPGECRYCWLYHQSLRHHRAWGGTGAWQGQTIVETGEARQGKAVSAANPRGDRDRPCVHLGATTGEEVRCTPCGGNVRLKVFGCAVHGACTRAKPAPGLRWCGACDDYNPGPAPPTPEGLDPTRPGS